MDSKSNFKGQIKHLLMHFGVQFENPYLEAYSPLDEAIEEVMATLQGNLDADFTIAPAIRIETA